MKTYPLTESQLGMFLEWNADRKSSQYTVAYAYPLPACVDFDALERAIRSHVEKHPVFRTRLVEEDGEVRQGEDPEVDIPFERLKMSVAEMEQYEMSLPRPFDLFEGPLCRFALVELPEGGVLITEFSHLIVDGTSLRVMNEAVSAAYNGEEPCAAEEASFAEYAAGEAATFDSAAYREAAADAQARFAGKAMTCPEGKVREKNPPLASSGAVYQRGVASLDRMRVEAYCHANGLHPNLFFMGVFARVLGLYANEREVVFRTINHGRSEERFLRTQGLFVKSVPVLGELRGERTAADYFRSFRLHRAGAYPFTHVCRDLGFGAGWGCVYQAETLKERLTLGASVCEAKFLMSGGSGEMPTMQFRGTPATFELVLSCLPGRYDNSYLQEFAERCATFARNAIEAGGETPLKDIPLLSFDEEREVCAVSKGAELEYDREKTFVDQFVACATRAPEHEAVVDAEGTLTYGELNARSDALATKLMEAGVKPNGFVGLMLPRTGVFPTSFIAVQKCGAGYVPMDADYPADRLSYMLENSDAALLLTTRALFEDRKLPFSGKVLFVDELDLAASSRPVNLATPKTPAYMIYTSGSTGKPKGVVLSNRALAAMIAWFVQDFGLGPGKRNLSLTSFSFDASVPDLFPPLAAGGVLHILSDELRKDLEGVHDYAVRVRATGLTTSTQLGLALVNTYPELPLEYMMLGGEKMVPFASTPVRILNGYGPTEFAVCSSYHEVNQAKEYDIPIGRAVPNSWSLVIDKLGCLVPQGMVGELALAGRQIADGYWHLPEKTASVFVPAPAHTGEARMYRTGDLVKYDDAGELRFLGRIDFQVKLRGFRIEIGEIEHAAAAFPGVGAVAAEVREIAGAKHLVLYYEGGVDAVALKAKMAETLTSYMVPDFFVGMAALPLTPNGKIDRRKLPAPQIDDLPSVPPKTDLEKRIFDIVAGILKTKAFGVAHDFNRLGLTSLGAMSLMARLKKECNLSVTMKLLMAKPTVRALAECLSAQTEKPMSHTTVRRRPKRATYPMTENQRGIYADWLKNPDALQYNIPAAFKFAGVKPEDLTAAAESVFAVHPAFMTRFAEKDGEIVQQRRDDLHLVVTIEKIDFEPDASFLGGKVRPFHPDDEVLARGKVFSSPTASYLFLDIHHTVFDGFSVGLFLKELMRVLDGREPEGETYTSFDAALDERDYLESEALDENDKWFARYLEGAESTSYPASSERSAATAGEGARVSMQIEGTALTARARELGVTPSDWLLVSFMELLKRIGREEDVLINFVTAGRGAPETQGTIGMFVKTLPIRGVRNVKTFAEAVRAMHESVTDLIDRECHSYVRLSERLGIRPDILFAFEGEIFDLPKGVELISPELKTAKTPLAVIVTPVKNAFELVFEYDRSMYARREMEMLLEMFARLAENAVAAAESDLKALPLLSDEEAESVLSLSRGPDIAYDDTRTVVNLVHANALSRSFATAVVDCETSITYGELDARSDALAAILLSKGVKTGGFVGLMLPRRVSFIISVLAVQKCGAGYVPMDADYPADRLAYMLENSDAAVLLTTRALFEGKKIEFGGETVFFEAEMEKTSASAPPASLNLSTPKHPAYMIYTSGSTGKPKGVVISHLALRHVCAWAAEMTGVRPGSKIVTHASFSFDASVLDIFPTLSVGGELHVYSEEIRKDLVGMRAYIIKNAIEGGTMSTQIGMALLDAYPDLPLRYLVVGGEKMMPISRTSVRIFNGYGPTEFTVMSSCQIVDQSREGDIPIGRPVPGTSSLIVDRYGHLLPQGFTGELALSGPQIADGYWRLPEKTAAVFVASPPGTGTERMYRTGDLARYNDEGTLDYLGRIDFQVKLRGFRIEIGEIEHCASTYPGVKGVAAEVREVAGAKHLILYYASENSLDEVSLKAHLATSLTEYMVPDYFVRMDAMPLTPNGKINRKLLPSPEGTAFAASEYVEPANETERIIAAAYGKILRIDRFGATMNFFASGGTSLIGIKAVVALQKEGLDVQYGDLFKYKTPRELASFLTGETLPATSASSSAEKRFDYGDYDYEAINRLLMATPTELFGKGFKRHSLGDILLCGATGYLGIHVLRYLLESTDSTVYALVRPKRGIGIEKRLDSQYVYYFGERLPRRFRDRISFVEGDITDANLGEKLKGIVIGAVFNCAALVKHYIADDKMDRINVGGVENLIAWCSESGARLVHISTYSVGGMIPTASPAVLSERYLYIGQESDNDYVRTKFLAERAVLSAVAAGRLRGKIMRLGNLMGREVDGEFQMNVGANAFVNSLKSYKALGAYPLENLVERIEMSPIDRVAEAVCLLATTPDGMCVFHPYNCYPLNMGAVVGALCRRGYSVDWVSREDFAATVDAMRNDPTRANDLQGILHYTGHILKDRRITPTSNDWTTTVLYRLGFRWKPADDGYLANFLEMLDGLAVFD